MTPAQQSPASEPSANDAEARPKWGHGREPTTTYHEIVDGFVVEIAGTGGRSVDQLRAMYERQQVADPGRAPDLRCELTTDEPDPEAVLGWSENCYGREGDRFVVKQSGTFLTVDEEWHRVATSPDWEPYHTVYVVEFEARRRLAAEGWALLHACGFEFNGQTVLCPSLRGAGKTNTLFSVLQVGGSYLSDDRVWVNRDGAVRGYPVPVNPHTEQYQSFPGLIEPEMSTRERVAGVVGEHCDPRRSVLDKGLLFLSSRFLTDDGRSFRDIGDITPDTTYVPESDTDRVALLRAAPRQSQVTVEDASADALARALKMIHHYEWNDLLTEYFLAFDALFPAGDRSDQLERLLATEQATFDELLDTVETDLVMVPRERNWKENGTVDDMRTTLERLTEPAPRAL